MGCATCSSSGCTTSSGGCNRLNTHDWFSNISFPNHYNFNIIEIRFKHGARKGFYKNEKKLDLYQGDWVVVEAAQGYDIGEVSLKGELVKLQMKKKKVKETSDSIRKIMRIASQEEIEHIKELRGNEKEFMIKARVIARKLNLNMKIGDVEFQGDGKKATFYYTAEDRVDFRELVKQYAKEFKVKIEMRQIGSRQEASRIGGMGSCGRELCCSSWLTDYKSVTTSAARYQQLSINSDKLSGQCGRLKCCLNYELDSYMDALRGFPKNIDRLETSEGVAFLRKKDIFKQELVYGYEGSIKLYALDIESVRKISFMNKQGKKPASLSDYNIEREVEKTANVEQDLVGQISLKMLEKRGKKKRTSYRKKRRNRKR